MIWKFFFSHSWPRGVWVLPLGTEKVVGFWPTSCLHIRSIKLSKWLDHTVVVRSGHWVWKSSQWRRELVVAMRSDFQIFRFWLTAVSSLTLANESQSWLRAPTSSKPFWPWPCQPQCLSNMTLRMERDGIVKVRTLPYAFCLVISILTIALKPLRIEDCICEWQLSPPLPYPSTSGFDPSHQSSIEFIIWPSRSQREQYFPEKCEAASSEMKKSCLLVTPSSCHWLSSKSIRNDQRHRHRHSHDHTHH